MSRVNGKEALKEDLPETMPAQHGINRGHGEGTLGHEVPVSNRTTSNHLLRYSPDMRRKGSCMRPASWPPAEIAGAGVRRQQYVNPVILGNTRRRGRAGIALNAVEGGTGYRP